MRTRNLSLAALLGVSALAAMGCGSDSSTTDTTSSTSSAMTKTQFLAAGNKICQQGNKEIDSAGKQAFSGGSKPSQSEFTKFATTTLIPSIQGQIDDLRALTPPAGDESTVSKFLDDAQADIDKAKTDPATMENNSLFAQVNKEAEAYGLTACGGG